MINRKYVPNPSRRIRLKNILDEEISAEENSAEDKVEINPSVNPINKTVLEKNKD